MNDIHEFIDEHLPPTNEKGEVEEVVEPCPIDEYIEERYLLATT